MIEPISQHKSIGVFFEDICWFVENFFPVFIWFIFFDGCKLSRYVIIHEVINQISFEYFWFEVSQQITADRDNVAFIPVVCWKLLTFPQHQRLQPIFRNVPIESQLFVLKFSVVENPHHMINNLLNRTPWIYQNLFCFLEWYGPVTVFGLIYYFVTAVIGLNYYFATTADDFFLKFVIRPTTHSCTIKPLLDLNRPIFTSNSLNEVNLWIKVSYLCNRTH